MLQVRQRQEAYSKYLYGGTVLMADYDWFDRSPTEAEVTASEWRPQGLHAVFEGLNNTRIKYYMCRRGCGTLVWSPTEHIKNVCVTWNPVAGK